MWPYFLKKKVEIVKSCSVRFEQKLEWNSDPMSDFERVTLNFLNGTFML